MPRPHDEYRRDFLKLFNGLAPHRHRLELFSDFVEMAACAIRKQTMLPGEAADGVEARYMEIVGQNNADDIRQFPKLLRMTQLALEDGGCDFLGEIASELEILNPRTGQFFTPFEVSAMMAEMTVGEAAVPERGFFTVSDPACGAASQLIAVADALERKGLDIGTQLYVEATDISALAFHMAYIQLAARGVPARVVRGNSLSLEFFEAAVTPTWPHFMLKNAAAWKAWNAEGKDPVAGVRPRQQDLALPAPTERATAPDKPERRAATPPADREAAPSPQQLGLLDGGSELDRG